MNINFEELKSEIISGDWEKIGSKFNNPILSIFPEEIKETLLDITYIPNKLYYLDDNTHEFKIQSLIKEDKPFFVLFAKSKHPIIVEKIKKETKGKFKYTTKMDQPQIILIVVAVIIVIASVALSGPILKVLGV